MESYFPNGVQDLARIGRRHRSLDRCFGPDASSIQNPIVLLTLRSAGIARFVSQFAMPLLPLSLCSRGFKLSGKCSLVALAQVSD
jgi:hypothetical protein